MITQENFALYAADFLDGKLSPEDTILFLEFLRKNPDLKSLITDFDRLTLMAGDETYPEKDTLYRDFSKKTKVTTVNFDEFAVASAEKILTVRQTENLNLYLTQHPEKQKDFNLYHAVYLSPDLSIRFPNKRALYRNKKRNLLRYGNIIALAASVILLVGLYILLEKHFSGEQPQQISSIKNPSGTQTSEPSEKTIPAFDQTGIPGESKYHTAIPRTKVTASVNFAANTSGTNELSQEIPLKDIQAISLQPVPYTYPSLGIHTTAATVHSGTSINRRQKAEEEYMSLSELAAFEIRKRIKPMAATEKSSITLWDIAEAGVNGLGKLTGTRFRLDRKLDPSGNIIAVDFESPIFALSAPVKKNN